MSLSLDQFISDWAGSAAHERANFQPFLIALCGLLDVEAPRPSKAADLDNTYAFERPVILRHMDGASTTGFIDLYKRGCFVMEAKQGGPGREAADEAQGSLFGGASRPANSGPTKTGTAKRGTRGWDDAMLRAKAQAERYAKALPASDGWPPFLLVVDVGHVFEVYADFTGTGKHYSPFPDATSFRKRLGDLRSEETRNFFRAIWEDPFSLDPARRSAKVTREVAARLAELAKAFEAEGHDPQTVARFLMRCLFTMFAEDVDLIPRDSFRGLLTNLRDKPAAFVPVLEELWRRMDEGGYAISLGHDVPRFNGGLFKETRVLPVDGFRLGLLIEAAKADWRDVEPAIFGTLLERALDERERHRLGAHYTPRPYVERLVMPTVIEPLRADWEYVQVAAVAHSKGGRAAEALGEVRAFHEKLCATRVLDPACGTGNFLYVTLEHMKRLEGEVIDLLRQIGGEEAVRGFVYEAQTPGRLGRAGVRTVDPHQFLGLEINPRAVPIAELVLWIGYLQWNMRTFGSASPGEPVLRDFRTIERKDALLVYDGEPELARDEAGRPVTRWDGVTFRTHPVTGEAVPHETARREVLTYRNARAQAWPQADFIVGNPPFLGGKGIRAEYGDGYAEALWAAYPHVPPSADFVMFWWEKAALAARGHDAEKGQGARRFGFITTNSISGVFSRRVMQRHLDDARQPLSLVFAIPDHPWVQESDGAAVRIAMTVAEAGQRAGRLSRVVREGDHGSDALGVDVDLDVAEGRIAANLRLGADLTAVKGLQANEGMSNRGVVLHGSGFLVEQSLLPSLGLGRIRGLERHVRPYRNGRDLVGTSRKLHVIDLFGLGETEIRDRFPEVYQWVLERVKPERDANNRESRRKNWWIFGEPISTFRPALAGIPRYIATVETAKHRVFQFLDASILPDNMLVCVASDDPFHLGVLSSRFHVVWALARGGSLEDRPRYNKTQCFDPFPFPDLPEPRRQPIRAMAERLDAHRKARQALHPDLTITGLYNVLAALREGRALSEAERDIHARGLVGILRQLHDDLDAAVAEAYGWPVDLPEEEILLRLVALNHQRAAEERRGLVRWLRPAYQNPAGHAARESLDQIGLAVDAPAPRARPPFPKAMPQQVEAIRALLDAEAAPMPAAAVASAFRGARRDRVLEGLEALAILRHVDRLDDGRYVSTRATMRLAA